MKQDNSNNVDDWDIAGVVQELDNIENTMKHGYKDFMFEVSETKLLLKTLSILMEDVLKTQAIQNKALTKLIKDDGKTRV